MQEICSSYPPVVTGICDPNKSRARHHRSLKLGSKLNHLIMLDVRCLMHYQEKNFFVSVQKKQLINCVVDVSLLENLPEFSEELLFANVIFTCCQGELQNYQNCCLYQCTQKQVGNEVLRNVNGEIGHVHSEME